MAFSLDGLTLFSGSEDKTIRVWSCAKGTHIQTHSVEQSVLKSISRLTHSLSFLSSDPKSIEFSLDGHTLHIATESDTVDWSVSDLLNVIDP